MNDLLAHVLFLTRHLKRNDENSAVIAILMDVGVPEKLIGFEDLIHVIILHQKNPGWCFTKEIYPEAGKLRKIKTDWAVVEKSIRYAIGITWIRRKKKIWRIYFPPDEDGKIRRPTNAEFISRIAQILDLLQNCRKEEAHGE